MNEFRTFAWVPQHQREVLGFETQILKKALRDIQDVLYTFFRKKIKIT